ncbi:MAG TPA: type II and III secretion system protein family protein [Caulobacteraceae bacterium]|jgi:pilus assembly protein CpaC|nr:type II and III secretion system protein family protein [Caulobacteraceae bacterium]
MKRSAPRFLAGKCLAALGAAIGLAAAAPGALGQTATTSSGVVRVNVSDQGSAAQVIAIPKGKSAIVELPADARDVLVTDPRVADAVLRSPRRIYIMGIATGQTDAVFFDAAGRRILSLNVRVDVDYTAVSDTIDRIVPGSRIHVEGINNSLILSGQVRNLSDADRAVQIAQQFTAKPEQVVNMLSIAGKEQVMLKVRIVEMQRSVIKQLGFDLSALAGQLGSPQFLLGAAATYGVNGSLLGGLTSGYSLDTTQQPELQAPCGGGVAGTCPVVTTAGKVPQFTGSYTNPSSTAPVTTQLPNGKIVTVPPSGTVYYNYTPGNATAATTQTTAGSSRLNKATSNIQAFESVGLVRVLAEPNLTAVSGESAKFLAGGEFPVPTGEDNTGKVSIEFKPFGVGLGFTPVVLSSGRISLKISTEVSELSQQGALTLAAGSSTASLTIPSLTVRRAETSVELPSGGGMMIAGLLQEETKQDIDSVPGLQSLPVLGALFRSRDYQEGETELVVIVTPYLVNPTNPSNLQTPADGFQVANDAETDLLGRINKTYHAPPAADATANAHGYQGPVGYIIE